MLLQAPRNRALPFYVVTKNYTSSNVFSYGKLGLSRGKGLLKAYLDVHIEFKEIICQFGQLILCRISCKNKKMTALDLGAGAECCDLKINDARLHGS